MALALALHVFFLAEINARAAIISRFVFTHFRKCVRLRHLTANPTCYSNYMIMWELQVSVR
jgi:hypothetical protein